MDYVLNKRSHILHRLPASESCNTDQIVKEDRFFIHASEEVVSMIPDEVDFRKCRRCFRAS